LSQALRLSQRSQLVTSLGIDHLALDGINPCPLLWRDSTSEIGQGAEFPNLLPEFRHRSSCSMALR
jgi:hypothetical protein